jgi:reverse gyrase
MENKTNIIVFNLESNKYYLDESNNINKLFEKNINWIKKYNPISIKTIIENINIKDIDKHVRVYMHNFGINNVRGGSYKDEILNIDNIKEGENLNFTNITSKEKYQNPVQHYTEGNLIKKMEKIGIGRPSTYSNIIETIIERKYIEKKDLKGTFRFKRWVDLK